MLELLWNKSLFHFAIMVMCIIMISIMIRTGQKPPSNQKILLFLPVLILLTELIGFLKHTLFIRDYLEVHFPYILSVNYVFELTYVPILFLYLKSLYDSEWDFKTIALLHWTPAVAVFMYWVYKMINPAIDIYLNPFERNMLFSIHQLQFLIYGIIMFIFLRRNHTKKKLAGKVSLYIAGLLIWKCIHLFEYFAWSELNWISETFAWLLYVMAELCMLLFMGKLFHVFLSGTFDTHTLKSNGKYKKTLISEKQREELHGRLLLLLESKKIYLNPDLDLTELSNKLESPAHHVSQTINTCFNTNFFDLINQYRVNESKKLFDQYDNSEKTVLEILYASGFNSKSVFNTHFKKYTGMTPSDYRKKVY